MTARQVLISTAALSYCYAPQRLSDEAEAADAYAIQTMADKERELQEVKVMLFDQKYERCVRRWE